MVYLFAILLAVMFWFLVNSLSKTQEFQRRPEAEQRSVKRKILWGIYGGLAIGCLLAWLMQSGNVSWVPGLLLVVYSLIWLGGSYLLWLAYVFGVRRDFAKLVKADGKQFSNPQRLLKYAAVMNLFFGCALLLIAAAIPLFGIDLKQWGVMTALVLAGRNYAKGLLDKSDSAQAE